MTFIDMLGLNDPVIAKRHDFPMITYVQSLPGHSKGDPKYVLSRKPDYIIAGPAVGTDISEPWFLNDVEFSQLPEFEKCYELKSQKFETEQASDWRETVLGNPLGFLHYKRTCN